MNLVHSIIVADPEPNRCETKCALLRDAGWAVNPALTAAHTHGHVAKGGISLLVLHTAVASDDGADLCRKIKDANPDILVLHTAPEAYDSCADGYLSEPIDPTVLLASCRSLLRLREASLQLEERAEHLKLAQEAAGLAVVDWNLASERATWSPNLNAMFGIEAAAVEGPVAVEPLLARVHADDRERVTDTLKALRAGGGAFDDCFRVTCPDGRLRWIAVRGQCVAASPWSGARMLGAVFDVTARREADEFNAFMAAMVASSGDAIIAMDPAGRVINWNEGATALFGYDAEEVTGKEVDLLVPGDRSAERADLAGRLRDGQSVELQTVRLRKSGRPIHVWLQASPIRSAADRIIGYSCIYRDMTEARQRQHHVHQLLRELAHRSKNLMAVIQAMARHSLASSPSPEGFVEKFVDRLRSLSVSHDLLSNADWRGAPLRDLARQQFGAHAAAIGSRILMEGPDLMLLPAAAQTIGMALHELSCNAATHGALSGTEGDVLIRWRMRADEAGHQRFEMEWLERGGPTRATPVRRGFGHMVVGRVTGQALGGTSALEFVDGGIRWTLTAPVAALVRDAADLPEGPPAVAEAETA